MDAIGIIEKVMAWLSLPVVSALVGTLAFYRYRRKKEQAAADKAHAEAEKEQAQADSLKIEAEAKAIDQWQELFAKSEELVAKKDAKIDELYSYISTMREQINEEKNKHMDDLRQWTQREIDLLSQLHGEKLANAKFHCEVEKCSRRQPQNGY